MRPVHHPWPEASAKGHPPSTTRGPKLQRRAIHPHATPLLPALIATACFLVLIIVRFSDAPKQDPMLYVRASAKGGQVSEVRRGQELRTRANEFVEYQFPDGTIIALDQNTALRFDTSSPSNKVTLFEGRVAVWNGGQVQVQARNSSLNVANCVVTHYGWLDAIEVTPLAENGCNFTSGSPIIQPLLTTKFSTFDNKILGTSDFVPEVSQARSFFYWTGIVQP